MYNYPVVESQAAVDTYYGKQIRDEFRIIEDMNNPEVKRWISEEKKFYNTVTENISSRDMLFKEVEDLLYSSNIRSGVPRPARNRIFFERRYLKEKFQKIFYAEGITGEEVEIFSTAELNKDGKSYRIDYFEPSYDGKYVALGVSFSGNELAQLRVCDVQKKTFLPEIIERARYGNPQWLPDGAGFFYKQLKDLTTDEAKKTRYEDSRIKFHRLNTDPDNDKEVFSRAVLGDKLNIDKMDLPYLYTFPDANIVIAGTLLGTQNYYHLYYAALDDVLRSAPKDVVWKTICKPEEKVTAFSLAGRRVFLLSFEADSNGRIESRSLENTDKRIVLEESESVLQEMIQNNNSLFVKSLKDGINRLYKIDLNDLTHQELELPYAGAFDIQPGFKAYVNDTGLFINLGAWTKALKTYYYNAPQNDFQLTSIRPDEPTERNLNLEVEEVVVRSHDGVLVPLSIIYNKAIEKNSKNPTILYGYGAYGTTISPGFDPARLAWLRRGGIYAVAHVRGGGEKGDSWYKGGHKATKSNSWKDFIACAEYLVEHKYSSPPHLAAEGESAGGITIGRAITERPDLFKAAVILYGKLNTVRHENTFNSANITEYGTVKDAVEFDYLYNMDVYHHIQEGVRYPSVLFSAGMNDSRVEPWQPAKAVAKMQRASAGNSIVLFRINDEGHFGGSNVAVELTDKYAFLLWQLGHKDFKYKGKTPGENSASSVKK